MALTISQINTLEIIERTNASISVVSTLILLSTFCFVKSYRTLSNTLLFFASFANLFANVAALIGRAGVSNPNGALCQFQAFLLEMFMQSDPLWSCAMAINVYLCFFRRFDQNRLRRLNWLYALLCYGIPATPAIFCLFYQDAKRGKMYGDATLWCWIGNNYKGVRIYSYYLPIWIAIFISLSIYLRVGIVIYKVRAQIHAFDRANDYTINASTVTSRRPSFVRPFSHDEFKIAESPEPSPSSNTLHKVSTLDEIEDIDEEMGLGMGISRWDSADVITRLDNTHSSTHTHSPITSPRHYRPHPLSKLPTHNPHHDFHSAPPTPTTLTPPSTPLHPSLAHSHSRSSHHSTNTVKYAYTKSALLFTISILITWVPASINRAQGLTHPNKPSYALNVMSAFVLPLQGFWNTVIFFYARGLAGVGRERGRQRWKGEKRVKGSR